MMDYSENIYLNKLKQFGGKLLFESNHSENEIDTFIQNALFKDIVAAWCHWIKHPIISSYRHEILWNNSNIKVEDNARMYSQWYSSGINILKTNMKMQQSK